MAEGHSYRRSLVRLRALVRDALLGAVLVFCKELLAFLPNVEMVSMLIIAYTVVYRWRALVPIYVFVVLEAVLYPFPPTVVMYLYVWAILFLVVLLLPRKVLPAPVYMLIGGLFGLAFGALCAPVQAAFFHLSAQGTLAWIAAGFSFDITHAVGNVAICCLTPVVIRLLLRLERHSFSN
ncbi:MAG: hypothetical protein IJY20_03520 [Clostridia bacterium]|nr:hypothetical protein [Clostridia bacterium]